MSEKSILNKLQLYASSLGHRLFRNNVGKAYTGETFRYANGDVLIKNPRLITFGLPVGSGDLFGGTQIKIEPHHVGRTFLVVTNYEVKYKKTRTTAEQIAFHNAISKLGGISIVDRFQTTDIKGATYVESINQFSATRG